MAVAIAGIALVAAAQSPVPEVAATSTPGGAGLTPEQEAELAALEAALGTVHEFILRSSVGWRDNLLRSPFSPVESAFGRAELEAFLWRQVFRNAEIVGLLNGDVLRYLSPPPETAGEQQWFGHAEGRWQPIEAARFTLKMAGFYQDAVIDLSEMESVRIVAPTKVQGAVGTIGARLNLPRGLSFEPTVQLKRTDYREFAGDYDESGASGLLEWKPGDALRMSVSYGERRRRYDERQQFTAGGRALAGTRLRFHQREGEFKLTTAWARWGEWTAGAAVGLLSNRDRASGYFDYDQERVRLEVGWTRDPWKVSLVGSAKRIDYRVQTVGIGLAPPPRIEDAFDVTMRIERVISATWIVFADQHWERSRSNQIDFNYRANTVLAGVQRAF